MKKLPSLSESQLRIMHVLWNKGEATLGEIWTELSQERTVAKNTVQTILKRLVDKGWVSYRQIGNSFAYRATREQKSASKQILIKVLEATFLGSTEGLVATLLDGRPLSRQEADRLRVLINEAEQKEDQR